MAKRDFFKTVCDTQIPKHYDISSGDIIYICSLIKQDNTIDAIAKIHDVFKYGFALGVSYQKNKGK